MDRVQAFNIFFLIGRIMVGGCFLAAFHHSTNSGTVAGYANSEGAPASRLAVRSSGVLVLLGGLSFLLGYHRTIGAGLLSSSSWASPSRSERSGSSPMPLRAMTKPVNLGKNIAMIGFC